MEDLRTKIQASHDNLVVARKKLLEAKEQVIEAEEVLKDREASMIMEGIPGKNEKERDAYLRTNTGNDRAIVLERKQSERAASSALELALDSRRMWESMVAIERNTLFEKALMEE